MKKNAKSSSKADAAGVPTSERELIVIAHPQAGLRARGLTVASVNSVEVGDLASILRNENVALTPLFDATEERLQALTTTARLSNPAAPDFSVFYRVHAADDRLDELAKKIAQTESVEAAYVKPMASPPVVRDTAPPRPEDAPPVTPDFTTRQGYLEAAPGGIDARFAWTKSGGGGTGVRIIDVEGAWRFTHEDHSQNQGGVVAGTQSTDIGWRNHGTAVTGEFGGDRNNIGVTGICAEANVRAISIFGTGWGSAQAIRRAADLLGAGDIILIELHRPGPRFNFANRNDQAGYIAVEWWPDDLAAIQYATGRGVIVVEAGGNGAENLDDAIYSVRPANFPASWVNPFRRAPVDSRAIIVGAGAPPPGTHGRDHGPDRSRLDFSNFGACIDAQGWGREVTTCAYGDLQGGANENFWYTDTFSGTSSASPIVVGALGCIQGALRGSNRPLLTPASARNLLRTTGSAQQAAPGRPVTQRIGNRPNLREAINQLIPKITKEIFKEQIKERAKDKLEKVETKETKDLVKEGKEFKAEVKELEKIPDKVVVEKAVDKINLEKNFKEKDKDLVEVGGGGGINEIRPVGTNVGVEARLANIEQTVIQLAHFISPAFRPDLGASALRQEANNELFAQSAELQRQAEIAKSAKDQKDVEKPAEA